MSDRPSIPKTNRSLDGLDDLIGQSIGQKASYDQMFNTPTSDVAVGSQESRKPDRGNSKPTVTLRVALLEDVIIATKIEAVKRNTSAALVVELALRQYLNLPPPD